jgi:hypothetical protein
MPQATTAAPTKAPDQQSAVAIRDDEQYAPRTIEIGGFDATRVNNLIRTTSVVQTNPYLKPVVRQMLLDQPADTYPISQKKQGDDWVATELGISAVGLANLADAAGVVDVPQASGRADDGRNPDLVTYRATAAMRMPDGEWLVRTRECTVKLATVEKEIRTAKTKRGKENTNYRTHKAEPWSDEKIEAEIAKELLLKEKFMERLAETGAKNRVTRALLGLATKYTPAQIAKPFVFMAVVPDMSHPELRARMLDQASSAIGGLFGPLGGQQQASPRLLTAGPDESAVAHSDIAGGELTADEIEGDVRDVLDADDQAFADAPDGATREPRRVRVDEDGTQTVVAATAPKAADDEHLPWTAEAAKAEPAKKLPAEQQLLADLRELGAQGDDPDALASAEALTALGALFSGWAEPVIVAGLKAVWPDTKLQNISASMAAAIEATHARLGHETFEATWRAMAAMAAKNAPADGAA